MALQVEGITKAYGTDIILNKVSLVASDGEKIGLIGKNGAGKSTLLKIIAGQLSCDEGRILTPRDCRIGFLRQDARPESQSSIWQYMMAAFDELTELEEELRTLEERMARGEADPDHERILRAYGEKSELFEKRGGFEIKTRINTILTGMSLDGFDKTMPVSNLSGGEKTKLSLARLLLESPEVLLLDEPTNHLDFKTMQWLEGYLKGYKGIIIAVSHDRYFLDALVGTIYEVEQNKLTRYSGNYSKYLVLKKQDEEIKLKHYNAEVEKAKKLEDYVARNMVRASTSKMAKSRQKMLDRMDIPEKPVFSDESCRFSFDSVYRSYNDVLTLEDVEISVPKAGILTTLSRDIAFEVKRGEKAAIIGANGIGKSTLLKTILGRHEYYKGNIDIGRNTEISYYDQEQQQLTDTKTVFSEISDRFPLMDEVDIRTRLGAVLFKDEDVFKLVGDLSGGERARLMFLIIMLEKANVLILDEPTNHLDLPAKEALDDAIAGYEGTVLFVSHDRYFLNKTADLILELTEEGIVSYRGNYDEYINAIRLNEAAPTDDKQAPGKGAADYQTAKKQQSIMRSLEKKVAAAEERISILEEEISALEEQLANCGADFTKANELFAQKGVKEQELEDTYTMWNDCTEELGKNM